MVLQVKTGVSNKTLYLWRDRTAIQCAHSPITLAAVVQLPLVSLAGAAGCGGGGILGLFRGLGTGRGRGSEPDW